MRKKFTSPNPIIRIQRERVARFLEVKRGDGDHILYQGYHIIEREALMDVFLHWKDEWKGREIGLPSYILVDISGTDIRYASFDETHYFLSHTLPRRKPETEGKEYKL